MAIPSNYIDKITKEGDSRMICPAADKVRVENQNFVSDDLDGALNELAGGKANKDETYTKEEVNDKVPLRIAAIKNGDVITSTTDYGEIDNAVKEDWRDAYVVVNNESIFSFYQVEQNAIIFTRVDAEDGTQAYLAVTSNNVWSIEYSAISGGGEGTVTGIKVGSNTYEPTKGVVDISGAVPTSTSDLSNNSDFTTKAYVDAAVQAVKTALNNLMNGQSVTDAIDTFNEIVDFLDGIDTDDPTLANQLLTLSSAITSLQTDIAGVYTKSESDGRYVRGISVNGGTAQTPNNGNVNIVVPTVTLDNAPTAGSDNAVKSGGVKQAIDEKLSNVTVNAIPANSVTLQATESNGVLSIFLADNTPILQLSDTELSIGASGGDFTLNGLYLQNDIEMAVTGDFSLSGTNVVEANGLYKILAANANGSNTVHVAYSGSSGSASGSIAITCGSVSLSVSSIVYPNLPSNYTLCDYIESTSTSNNSNYIETNVPISSEIRVVAKIQNSKPDVIRFLYGARAYNVATILARVEGQSGSQGGTDVKNQRLIVHGSTFDESYLTDSASVHEFDVNKSRIIYDGQTYHASVVASNWSKPEITLVICGYKEVTGNSINTAAQNCILAKYYYFKIYDGDTLVRDYIPAKDNTTGKFGLYDLVNNTFSTSAGSVEFTGQVTT